MAGSFSSEDMAAVVESFYTAALAMMAVEEGGTRREFPVMVEAINELGTSHPDSAIVQALLTSNPGAQQERVVQALAGKSQSQLHDDALAAVKQAAARLAGVSAEEASIYREAMMHVLDKIADAAGELGFFGSEGAGVSEGEAKFLDVIKQAMG